MHHLAKWIFHCVLGKWEQAVKNTWEKKKQETAGVTPRWKIRTAVFKKTLECKKSNSYCSRSSDWKLHRHTDWKTMLNDATWLDNRLYTVLILGTETAHRYCPALLAPSCTLVRLHSLERHLMSGTCCASAFYYIWSSFSGCIAALVPQTQWSLTFSRVVRVQHSQQSMERCGTTEVCLSHCTPFSTFNFLPPFFFLPSLKHVTAYWARESASPSLLLRLEWPFPQPNSVCVCVWDSFRYTSHKQHKQTKFTPMFCSETRLLKGFPYSYTFQSAAQSSRKARVPQSIQKMTYDLLQQSLLSSKNVRKREKWRDVGRFNACKWRAQKLPTC